MSKKSIKKMSTNELINNYAEIQRIEQRYFALCKKFDPDAVYESDPCLLDIQLELGRRQIYLSQVEQMQRTKKGKRSA